MRRMNKRWKRDRKQEYRKEEKKQMQEKEIWKTKKEFWKKTRRKKEKEKGKDTKTENGVQKVVKMEDTAMEKKEKKKDERASSCFFKKRVLSPFLILHFKNSSWNFCIFQNIFLPSFAGFFHKFVVVFFACLSFLHAFDQIFFFCVNSCLFFWTFSFFVLLNICFFLGFSFFVENAFLLWRFSLIWLSFFYTFFIFLLLHTFLSFEKTTFFLDSFRFLLSLFFCKKETVISPSSCFPLH